MKLKLKNNNLFLAFLLILSSIVFINTSSVFAMEWGKGGEQKSHQEENGGLRSQQQSRNFDRLRPPSPISNRTSLSQSDRQHYSSPDRSIW